MTEEQEAALPKRIEQGYFSYPDETRAGDAASELEKIKRLEAQIDYNKPKVVYALYNKMLLGEVFSTPEGFSYLLHIRQYLEDHLYEIGEAVPGIPVEMFIREEVTGAGETEAPKERETAAKKKKGADTLSYRIVIVALVLLVIAMMGITALSDSPTILDYEKKLQDKYASWEMELSEREAEIRARELELKKSGD